MKLLLTSSGVTNPTIERALVALLGKPIAECSALVVPTGIHPFSMGPEMAARLVRGEVGHLTDLGWRSVGLLELTALPSIGRDVWVEAVRAADAVLVWGGDPLYLAHWMRESRFAEALDDTVYVGSSAGSMVTATVFGETYLEPRTSSGTALSEEPVAFTSADGDVPRTLVTAEGLGLVDFAVIPHLDGEHHPDASSANAEVWAAKVPAPVYALDDQSAVVVRDGEAEVVSEGAWRHYL